MKKHTRQTDSHLFFSFFNRWFIAYQTALSFRCSNYFVSFLSESSCLLCGIGTIVEDDKEGKLEWYKSYLIPKVNIFYC